MENNQNNGFVDNLTKFGDFIKDRDNEDKRENQEGDESEFVDLQRQIDFWNENIKQEEKRQEIRDAKFKKAEIAYAETEKSIAYYESRIPQHHAKIECIKMDRQRLETETKSSEEKDLLRAELASIQKKIQSEKEKTAKSIDYIKKMEEKIADLKKRRQAQQ